jgi:hypothetical protein
MSKSCRNAIVEVRQAYWRALGAEQTLNWHVAVQHYLYCLERARDAGDERAVRFFAARLSAAYGNMHMRHKATAYRQLC